jgi:hypothetical protein
VLPAVSINAMRDHRRRHAEQMDAAPALIKDGSSKAAFGETEQSFRDVMRDGGNVMMT